jgi:hypothetical protein
VATPAEVKVPTKTEPGSSTAPALLQDAASRVTGIRERSTKAAESAIDRPSLVDIHAPVEKLGSSLGQAPGVELLPKVGLLEAPISIAAEVARSSPLFGRVTSAAMNLLSSVVKLTGTDWGSPRNEVSRFPGLPPGLLSLPLHEAGLGRSSGGNVPPDHPLPPIPGSPEAVAPGSAGSFFVPLAALLALLALAAPAILRRLREVPDFPAPTPFVCALERPG